MFILYIFLILILLRYLWIRRKLYWLSFQLDGPLGWPILGNALMASDPEEILNNFQKLRQIYKSPLIRLWLGNKILIFTDEPTFVESILNNPKCLWKGQSYEYVAKGFGTGIFTSSGEKWKANKKLLLPSFNANINNDNIEVFNRLIKDMLCDILNVTNYDCDKVTKLVKLYAVLTIYETILDLPENTAKHHAEAFLRCSESNLEIASMRIFKLLYQFDVTFQFSKHFKKNSRNLTTLSSILGAAINDKILNYQNIEQHHLNNRLSQRIPKLIIDGVISKEDAIMEMISIIVAGFETTASAVRIVLLMLAVHTEYQEKLFDEIRKIIPEQDAPITKDDISRMNYLDMIIKEAFRLFPPGPLLTRRTISDVTIDNKTIPSGTEIIVGIYTMQRNKYHMKIEDPEKFNPDNFLPENIKKRHPFAYIPFSAGPISCVGSLHANTVVKMMVIQIVRHFSLSTALSFKELKVVVTVSLHIINKDLFKLKKRVTY